MDTNDPPMDANGHEKSGVVFAFLPFYSRLFVFIRGFLHGFLRIHWRSFAVCFFAWALECLAPIAPVRRQHRINPVLRFVRYAGTVCQHMPRGCGAVMVKRGSCSRQGDLVSKP